MESEISSTLTETASSLLSNGAPAEPTKLSAVVQDHRHFEFWSVLDPCKHNFKLHCSASQCYVVPVMFALRSHALRI